MLELDGVAARIQTHPSRQYLVRRLVAQLGAFEDLQVVADPQPSGPTDSWRSHRACLASISPAASHLLVLQDDALPQPDFAARLVATIAEHPAAVLVHFVPGFPYLRRQMQQARDAGSSLTVMRVGAFVPAVAISYPRALVLDLLDWADKRWTERQKRQLRGADDGVIAMYCRHHRVQPLLLVPSTVEHDDAVDSVGKHQRRTGPHRRAALL